MYSSKDNEEENGKEITNIVDIDIVRNTSDIKKEICIEEINFTHQIFGDPFSADPKTNETSCDLYEDPMNTPSGTEEKPNPTSISISNGNHFMAICSEERDMKVTQTRKRNKKFFLSCHLCEYAAFRHAWKKPFLNLCDIPKVRFHSRSKVREHMIKEHPNFQLRKCSFCKYETLYKSSLDRHIDGIHLNLRNHKCHMCDFSSTRKYDLKRHVDNVHLNLRAHMCPLCDFRSNRKYGLKKHLETVHSDTHEALMLENIPVERILNDPKKEAKCYRCHLCEYTSNRESNVERHIFFVHLKAKRKKKLVKCVLECRFCDFNTIDRASLRKHITGIHLNLRNHECHLCEYTSNQSGTLKNHINTVHLNLRRHECNICQYSSNHLNVLRTHIKRKHCV